MVELIWGFRNSWTDLGEMATVSHSWASDAFEDIQVRTWICENRYFQNNRVLQLTFPPLEMEWEWTIVDITDSAQRCGDGLWGICVCCYSPHPCFYRPELLTHSTAEVTQPRTNTPGKIVVNSFVRAQISVFQVFDNLLKWWSSSFLPFPPKSYVDTQYSHSFIYQYTPS